VAPNSEHTTVANKALALLRSAQRLKQLRDVTRDPAKRLLSIRNIIQKFVKLVRIKAEKQQWHSDLQQLQTEHVLDPDFYAPGQRLSNLVLHQRYLLSWRSGLRARKPFPGFHPGIYREKQLANAPLRDPLAHWIEQGKPAGPWKLELIEPATTPDIALPPSAMVALHIHVFYPELLGPMLERLAHNRIRPDLFLSYSDPRLEPAISQTLAAHQQQASLYPVPNRGRDIGPLLSELGQHLDQAYSFHGHLHTKKSVLIDNGIAARWREFLLINLLGDASRQMADRILAAMQSNSNLGLVFPDDPGCLGWTKNREQAEALAERLALKSLPEEINFPVGTMFWARQGALSSLYQLGLEWNDYPPEPLGYDGTILHAIERLLPQICLASGNQYALTHVPGFSR